MLHFAAEGGNPDIVRRLLDLGLNVNANAEYDRTPLHMGCKAGHTEVVQILLDHGEFKSLKETYGVLKKIL